jgi:hypothetical protein
VEHVEVIDWQLTARGFITALAVEDRRTHEAEQD